MSVLPTAWCNGSLVDAATLTLPAFDHGLTVGDGVFETLKVVRGVPFAVRRHLDRLCASAAGLGLPLPDVATVRQALLDVVAANHVGNVTGPVLRVTYTCGPQPLGSGREPTCTPTLLVAGAPTRAGRATASVHLVPWVRNERGALAGLKTTSYGENVVALAAARAAGADEALFANTVGNLCEGTGTNVFVAVDGRLVTPPLSSGCLDGVTRTLLVELGVAVEQDVPVEMLESTPEACLTSTTRDVQPITAIDRRSLETGPLTAAAAAAFSDLVARDLDP